MSNKLLRTLTKQEIQRNPFTLSGNLYPVIDNGFGENIENRSGVPVITSYTNEVRIFKKKKPVKKINDSSTPYVYEEVYYLLSDYETVVAVGLEFTYNGMDFKVKTKEPLIKFGDIIRYQYELKELTEESID